MTLKERTVTGIAWSLIDNFAKQGINFIIGIILARLLLPREFGLIGMTTIFFAISQTFISSGFGDALIRKKDCSQKDYSTVFYYNFFAGSILFVILFFLSGPISLYFDEPQLRMIIRVLSLGLIITGFSLIQQTILVRRVDFKLLTKVSVISSLASGAIGIWMAFSGYGVWSLVAKMMLSSLFTAVLLWIWNKWRPTLEFSIASLREMFSFGSRLMMTYLIDTVYRNIYLLVIGKYFSAEDLGFYTRADQFSNLPAQNITIALQRVSFPILASIQDQEDRLKNAYIRLIKSTMLISVSVMAGVIVVARQLILVLIGEKWLPVVPFLQILSIAAMIYPLQALNINMINVKGRSDIFLRLEIIKKALAVPVIVVGILWGIKYMLLGIVLNAFIAYFLNSFWSGRLINYSSREQLKDISPSILIAFGTAMVTYAAGRFIDFSPFTMLMMQAMAGVAAFLTICELLKREEYLYLKRIVVGMVKRIL